MQIDVTLQDLRILLAWAEDATGAFDGVGAAYLTQAEIDLVEKLKRAAEAAVESTDEGVMTGDAGTDSG
ncbi:MAG: hypothetical protein HY318_18730 [Armatimonadetes bacterium]|nr:hypothetical protein [Armatimonadota bacterium]